MTQIIWSKIYNSSPSARGGETFLDCFHWLAFAICEKPVTRHTVGDENTEDVLRHTIQWIGRELLVTIPVDEGEPLSAH